MEGIELGDRASSSGAASGSDMNIDRQGSEERQKQQQGGNSPHDNIKSDPREARDGASLYPVLKMDFEET
ncbi:pH-response transcription factor pacC/RIM101 [Histoplasma capsulatum H143]|nr:pH-response transcription factor pacC/RIM101 [Histoplasma capsulatum H143]